MDAPSILIIDDDDLVVQLMAANLEICGLGDVCVRYAATLNDALYIVSHETPAMIFLDNRVPPHADFRPIYHALRNSGYRGPVIIQSACIANDIFKDAPRMGISAVVDKLQINDEIVSRLVSQHLKTIH